MFLQGPFGKTLGYAVPVVNEVLLAHIANEKIKVSQSTVLKPTLQSGGDDVPSPLLVPAASNEVECDPTSAFEEEIDVADPLSPSLVPAALQFNGASAGILNFFAPIPQKKDESRPHGHGDGDLYSASPPRHSSPAETSVFSPVNEGTILSNILKDQSIPSGQNPSCAQGTCAHGACKRHAANTLVLFQGAHLATKELLSSPDANRCKVAKKVLHNQDKFMRHKQLIDRSIEDYPRSSLMRVGRRSLRDALYKMEHGPSWAGDRSQ
ncbi:hypothetical protein EAE99_000003 [Botrytis elliptica]|nr:hypothetical protein EAE99_000003 [Botrytis elliptica]